jgi:hypothetical protein
MTEVGSQRSKGRRHNLEFGSSKSKIRNSKHEIRNKSEIQIFQCSKRNALEVENLRFGHLDFDHLSILSDFDIRISNLRVLRRIKTNLKVPRWEN